MAKLVLKADPTFAKAVSIPVAGGAPAEVTFTFKHRTRDGLDAWLKDGKDRNDVDMILGLAEGWDLAEPFDAENVGFLVQNYIGAPVAILRAYIDELSAARLGN